MITTGIDVGNRTAKAVIFNGSVLSSSLVPTTEEGTVAAKRALDKALKNAKLTLEDLAYVVATGAGGKELKLQSNRTSSLEKQGNTNECW